MIATQFLRQLDLAASRHVSAASGLVILGEHFHVVADDENELGVFPIGGGTGRLQRLLDGELPAGKKERKARKPDFESLLHLPGHGLLAIGSGSRPTRERAVLVATTTQGDATGAPHPIDTSRLCARLRQDLPELNLEGAALLGERLVLLQRASAKDPRNALVFLPREPLLDGSPTLVFVDLGTKDGLPWTFTDACALPGGDLLATAVIEDTCDSYEDGACQGSALVRLSPAGEVRWLERLATDAKVEGIALHPDGSAWLVTDADDAAVPAQLLRVQLPR